MSIATKLLQTESEWNPKVMVGRALSSVLPASALHALKKHYYAYVLGGKLVLPESDQALAGLLVSEGESAIDIGASIGGYTKFLSGRVGSRGHVYSFEPNPPTFDFLSHNVRALRLSNVEVFNVAVSDSAGTAELKVPRYRWGSECHYDARLDGPVRPEWRGVTVKKSTLDALLPSQMISFIKCDANYHELACLRGAKRLIERCKPAMLIEVNPDPDNHTTSAYGTFELLRAAGYEAYWWDGETLHLRLKGEKSQNYFFLTASRLELLLSRGVAMVAPESSNAKLTANAHTPGAREGSGR